VSFLPPIGCLDRPIGSSSRRRRGRRSRAAAPVANAAATEPA
jgi:hypothetical protein